jgi:hypothetical protein
MLEPPIKNIGLAGIQRWADIIVKSPEQFKGMNLLGALMNGFMYIEISGTGGSAFRSMYARFLQEASSIINEPALNEVAGMMRQSARLWSEIASGCLHDSWPILKRMKDLMIEKNRLFKEQEPGASEAHAYFNEVIGGLKSQGCDAVVLGCTEIPLLVTQEDSPLPTLDSTRILARAALKRATDTASQ